MSRNEVIEAEYDDDSDTYEVAAVEASDDDEDAQDVELSVPKERPLYNERGEYTSEVALYGPGGKDPAMIPLYPPTFVVEIALQTASVKEICQEYNISRDDWNILRHDERFIADLTTARAELQKSGMSFKMKAQLQSEELLKTSWRMIHDTRGNVPASVRADLIKFTIRAAGLDGSKDQAANAQANAVAGLSITINL